MVIGKGEADSFSGVYFSLDPKDGAWPQMLLAPQSFGEDLMTGSVAGIPEAGVYSLRPGAKFPPAEVGIYEDQLLALQRVAHFDFPVRAELTVERGEFSLLQANRAELNGPVLLAFAVEACAAGRISESRLLELIEPFHIRQLFAEEIGDDGDLVEVAQGKSILAKCDVCGRAYFSNDEALRAKSRGEKVILIKQVFMPGDVETGLEVDGIISLDRTGIHAATLARRYGMPVLINVHDQDGGRIVLDGNKLVLPIDAESLTINEGDEIALSSEEGAFYVGSATTVASEVPPEAVGAYQVYKDVALDMFPHQIEGVTALANLASYYRFLGEFERLARLINDWYVLGENVDALAQYFIDTDIGKHLPRLNLFNALSEDNQIRLITDIAERDTEGKAGLGTFILGRMVLAVEREVGEAALAAFLDQFDDHIREKLLDETAKARKYLEVSRVAPPKAKEKEEPRHRRLQNLIDKFGEDWVRKRGLLKGSRYDEIFFLDLLAMNMRVEAIKVLTLEQLGLLRFNVENDLIWEHKPMKVIRNHLADMRRKGEL